jgi:hypothetical protein
LSLLIRMLVAMGKSERQPRVRHVRPQQRHPTAAEPASSSRRASQVTPDLVLERIERTRLALDQAEAELAELIDHAVGMGMGWPDIATRLGVTRQAARQQYHRRHRSRRDRDRLSEPDVGRGKTKLTLQPCG